MLSYETVEPHTLELLKRIMAEPLFSDMRLVGGTALALQYGHRRSVDLFGSMPQDADGMEEKLAAISELHVIKNSERIRIYSLDKIKVDFVDYSRYPWIDKPVVDGNIRLASPRDIAAMKINAAEGWGTKKDFIDIYFLLQHYSLSDILAFYSQKYPEYSKFRALMSLTYFEDAENQLMPKMFNHVSWETVKKEIDKAVKNYRDLE